MVKIKIIEERCKECLSCVKVCNAPEKVYEEINGKPVVARPENCLECLKCALTCPSQAIEFDDVYISKVVLYDKKLVNLFDRLF